MAYAKLAATKQLLNGLFDFRFGLLSVILIFLPAAIVVIASGSKFLPISIFATLATLVASKKQSIRFGLIVSVCLFAIFVTSTFSQSNVLVEYLILGTVGIIGGYLQIRFKSSSGIFVVLFAIFLVYFPIENADFTTVTLIVIFTSAFGIASAYILNRKSTTSIVPIDAPSPAEWSVALVYIGLLSMSFIITHLIISIYEIQFGHWVLLTLVLLFVPSFEASLNRTWSRIAGTVTGALLAVLATNLLHEKWVLLSVAGISLFFALSAIRQSYAIFVVFLTLSVLILMGYDSSNSGPLLMRVIITIICGAVTIFLLYLASYLVSAIRLQSKNTLE